MSVVEEIELGGGRPLEGAGEVRGAGPVERAAPAVLGDDELEVGQPVEGATEARGEAVELAAPAQAALEDDELEDDELEDEEEAEVCHLSFCQIGRVCILAFTSRGRQPSARERTGKHTGQSLRSTVSS
jgi:hypothetical protein